MAMPEADDLDAMLEEDPTDTPDSSASALDEASAPDEEPLEVPLAEFDGLRFSYGTHRALGPFTLRLDRGCIGLLGPNGAGKSTLIRLMMGLLQPSGGSIRVLGQEVRSGARDLRRRIGYVPEGPARFPGLTGAEAVVHAARLVGMSYTSAVQRAHQVLDYVGLGEARYRDAATYSTGMRQRLKIAQALVHDPELLILDEPTEGVDPEAREEILALLAELSREHGLQLILSTHLLHDVERVATHALILNEGLVVQHGPVEALRSRVGAGYQVRVGGPPDAMIERLKESGIEHQWVPPDLRIQLDDPRKLLALADEAGLVVRHLAPIQLSLNEAFEEALKQAPAPDPADEGAAETTETKEATEHA